MNTIAQTVATSDAATDLAYYVCIVSFFIAGGVAIYLLWDKTKQTSGATAKTRVVKPSSKRAAATTTKKPAAKKAPAKKSAAKKRTAKTTKKK